MSNLFWLTDVQMARLEPFFPKSHGKPRVDDRRVLSGMIFINRNGLRWCDAPYEYGPPKTLYNRWKRWGDMGIFARIMEGLASEAAAPKTVMIDAIYLKVTARLRAWARKRGPDDQRGRLIGRTKGGMNTKIHAVTNGDGRPIRFFMTAGQVSDYTGAAALLGSLPKAKWLLADRGYDADWFRDALKDKGIRPCIPGPEVSRQARQTRQAPQQDRDHVRTTERLAKGCHSLRPMPEGLPLSRCPRRDRHVLAMKPE